MFTSVNEPLASITISSGTIIVGFSKSFGIGTDGNTGDSVICSGLDSRVVSCSGFSSSAGFSDSFSVVNDEHGSPTNANDLAKLILNILPKLENNTEIYHFSNLGFCSRFNFANQIKEYCKENVTIKPKQSDNDNNIRPRFSALDSSKIINKFGLNIDDWSSSLRYMLQIEKVYNTNEI